MVAYFCRGEKGLFPRYEVLYPLGLPILRVVLPPKVSPRRLEKLGGRLYRRGLRRFLSEEPSLTAGPLEAVKPLPLCRAKGGELALALVAPLPLRDRWVALRGEGAGAEAWAIAKKLCPQVGGLLLDLDRGEEELAHRLREEFGAAALPLGRGRAPQAAVELSPRQDPAPRTLRLWGEPDLLELTLATEEPLPPGFPPLPFLELLWETGRVELERVQVVRQAEWP